MDILPIIFRLLGKKQAALRLVALGRTVFDKVPPEAFPVIRQMIILGKQLAALSAPAYQQSRAVAPEAITIARDLWITAFPEIVARWNNLPVEGFSSSPWWIQTTLNRLGASPQLKVDNDIGDTTKAAILQFQKTHKQVDGQPLAVDGYAGFETLASMYAEVVKRQAK